MGRFAGIFILGLSLPLACFGEAEVAKKDGKPKSKKWMPDEAMETFIKLTEAEKVGEQYNEENCFVLRPKLLKQIQLVTVKESDHYRYKFLKELSMCHFVAGNYEKAKKCLDSSFAEMNFQVEELLYSIEMAPMYYVSKTLDYLAAHQLTRAATASRRAKEGAERIVKKMIKGAHKMASHNAGDKASNQAKKNAKKVLPTLDELMSEASGFGVTGDFLPRFLNESTYGSDTVILRGEIPTARQIALAVDILESKIDSFAPENKMKRKNLNTTTALGSQSGAMMYVRGMMTDAIVLPDRLMAAQEMKKGVIPSFMEEAAAKDAPLTLLKNSFQGTGCLNEEKGMQKTCKALMKINDVVTNVFGATRIIIVKPNKPTVLESCNTNANVAILIAAKDGVIVKVKQTKKNITNEAPSNLVAGSPFVFDSCREVQISATEKTPVLLATAWHPEFAGVERNVEIRSRAKYFTHSAEETKELTESVTRFTKTKWEKSGLLWRHGSAVLDSMVASLKKGEADRARAVVKKQEKDLRREVAKREDGDQKKQILEEKRAARRKQEEEAKKEAASKAPTKTKTKVKKEKEDPDAPWMLYPNVLVAQGTVIELKEAAAAQIAVNPQMESAIRKAERELGGEVQAAKKAYKSMKGEL